MHSNYLIQDIFIYPIKSLGGVSVKEAWVEDKGFQHDRRWMLVKRNGTFLSQRECPKMALLQVLLAQDALLVFEKNDRNNQIRIPFEELTGDQIEVQVWDDVVKAVSVNKDFDRWFSKTLGVEVTLVKMPLATERKVDPKYAKNGEIVSFADGMPYLIIGQSSLNDLNGKLEVPLPMDRFRPNVVFSGGKPFAEDQMKAIRIGDLEFSIIKPCARCVMTTIDQNTAAKGKEPLRTLASYRTVGNKVLFGQNMVALNTGKIRVGDPLAVIS
ncbi:MOSC domain-containing protein [Algoriphagus aestuarii]|nr:MOSC domain-containing protein [Algoriphagus aestuarii]